MTQRQPAHRARRTAGLVAALAVVLAVLVGACEALIPNPAIGNWNLRTVGGNPAAAGASIVFTSKDAVIETGCNQGAGSYTYESGRLTLAGMAFTAQACPEPALDLQDKAFRALAAGPSTMAINDTELTIDPGAGQPVLVFDRSGAA